LIEKEKQMSTLEKAIAIAATAHEGQRDKAGANYILHPVRIMMKMTSEKARIVAVLHDVVEDGRDNGWTFDRLAAEGFSDEIIDAIDGVTRRDQESYEEFIERSARNDVSREVKIGDLEDNMNVLRLNDLTPKNFERLERYHRAWKKLMTHSEGH
jgi:(p)ppGpp synthase/HD superfamily hydrolase